MVAEYHTYSEKKVDFKTKKEHKQYLDHQVRDQEVQAGALVLATALVLQKQSMVACAAAILYDQASRWRLQHVPWPVPEVVDKLHTSSGWLPSKRHLRLARATCTIPKIT